MQRRTVTRDLEQIARGDRGDVTIFAASAGVERLPYDAFRAKFTLARGRG